MTDEEDYIKGLEDEVKMARINADRAGVSQQQQQVSMQQEDASMIKEQLDLDKEITRIDYLIKGYSLEPSNGGMLEWKEPGNQDLVIFSEYGTHLIMETVCWYLTKNLLLSNYDEEAIKKKMLNFTNDLIDTIFMEYDKVFKQPTVQDCIKVLKDRIDKRTEITFFAQETAGLKPNLTTIKKEKLKEVEARIENELDKIKEQIIKSRLKRFVLIVRVLQDAIHNTYMRAWKGQERSTLRQHTHISESRNPAMVQPKPSGGLFPWSKR